MAGVGMPKNTLYETMTKLSIASGYGTVHFRVWRATKQHEVGPDTEVIARIHDVLGRYHGITNRQERFKAMAEEIALLPGIEAVEILDANGNGACLYPDWQ